MPVFFSKRYTTAALALIITSLALVWLASGPSNSDSFYKLKESVSTRIDTLRKAALAAYEPQRQNDQSSGQGSMPKASEPEAVREGQPDGKESPQSVSSWRTHLNLEHSASGEAAGQHSRSLHFSNIYVVQSPSSFNSGTSAQQHQERIQQLADALGIDYTWVPCTDPQSDLVKWIAEQVDDVRSLKREALSEQMSVPSASIGGSATGNVWLHPARPLPNATATVPEAALSQTWLKQSRIKPSYGSLHFPPLHSEEFESLNWLEWMNALSTSSFRNRLRPSDENMHISSLLHDPIETDDSLQLSAESISEWHTHTQLWQRIAFNQEHSSLILSDDIDLEFDLERQWLNIKSFLPGQSSTLHSEWQSVFLGHSSTVEQTSGLFQPVPSSNSLI